MTYLILKNIVLGPILNILFRPWVRGSENVPRKGGAVLASNHLSFVDSIFLPLKVKRPVTFLAKSDYFTGKGVKGALIRWFFKSTGQLPIDRSGGKASEDSLNTGLGVLERQLLLGIYPEGTEINYLPHIDMKTADGKVVPWLASQTDVLAEDWVIVP